MWGPYLACVIWYHYNDRCTLKNDCLLNIQIPNFLKESEPKKHEAVINEHL